jgi:hypothetical protein
MKEAAQENPISVLVDLESLHKGHNITGDIWLELLDFRFPTHHWNDFPVIILGWWLEAFFKLWSNEKAEAECLFMDGPYSYKIAKENNKHILRCYHRYVAGKKTEWDGEIDLDLLLSQVLRAASALINECRQRGWKTRDTEILMSRYTYIDGMFNSEWA